MPISRRRASDDMPDEERNSPPRRRRSRDEDEDTNERDERPTRRRSRDDSDDERPTRRSSRRSSRDEDQDEEKASREDRPRRRSRDSGDEGGSRRRRGTGGFGSYSQKRRATSSFASEFKPDSGKATLIKFLDAEPFDVYNQHWVDEGAAKGKTRHSFVCRDDEYFSDDDGCPLCDIGEGADTMSLFNIIDLTNPRKPEVVVWRTTPTVTDKLARMAESKRTQPLDRDNLYFEVTMVKTKNKTDWDIQPVKADDLPDDFDIDPFEDDELEDFAEKKFEDRTAITKVDSYEDLDALAESLE